MVCIAYAFFVFPSKLNEPSSSEFSILLWPDDGVSIRIGIETSWIAEMSVLKVLVSFKLASLSYSSKFVFAP